MQTPKQLAKQFREERRESPHERALQPEERQAALNAEVELSTLLAEIPDLNGLEPISNALWLLRKFLIELNEQEYNETGDKF